MPLFEAGQFKVHYQWVQRGSAGRQPILLLHGLGSGGQDWFPQWQAFSADWPILTLDFPGHGDSPPVTRPFTIAQLAEVVAELLRQQADEPCHLVGLSLGAVVGLQLALDCPGQMQSAMLVNGFANYQAGGRGRLGALLRLLFLLLGRMDWVGWWVARSVFSEPEHGQYRQLAAERIASVNRRAYWYYLKALGAFDLRPSLAQIEVPAMIVAGGQDRIVAHSAKLELAQGMPTARFKEFPASGHGTPIDCHRAFNQLLQEWVDSNTPNSRI